MPYALITLMLELRMAIPNPNHPIPTLGKGFVSKTTINLIR